MKGVLPPDHASNLYAISWKQCQLWLGDLLKNYLPRGSTVYPNTKVAKSFNKSFYLD